MNRRKKELTTCLNIFLLLTQKMIVLFICYKQYKIITPLLVLLAGLCTVFISSFIITPIVE